MKTNPWQLGWPSSLQLGGIWGSAGIKLSAQQQQQQQWQQHEHACDASSTAAC